MLCVDGNFSPLCHLLDHLPKDGEVYTVRALVRGDRIARSRKLDTINWAARLMGEGFPTGAP